MVDKFFIYSYPKTMSAWLSIYLTVLSGRKVLDFYTETEENKKAWGNIGSENLFYHTYLLQHYPDAKHIFVDRKVELVLESLLKRGITLSKSQIQTIDGHVKSLKTLAPALVVIEYNEDPIKLAREVCEEVGVAFDSRLAVELLRFNHQIESLEWNG